MSQQAEPNNNSLDPAAAPVKRKRGRPRKDDACAPDPSSRTPRQRRNPSETPAEMLGQTVSGVLDGVFDAGFFISVRVGNSGPLMRGLIFDPRLAVPITPANDVAPHIKMIKRTDFPIPGLVPAEPRREAPVPAVASDVAMNHGSQGSSVRANASESVIYGTNSAVSQEFKPPTLQVSDYKIERPTGEFKLGPMIQKPPSDETVQAPKPEVTEKKPTIDQSGGDEPKIDTKTQNPPALEKKLAPTILKSPGNESTDELKPDPTSHKSPVTETVNEPKPDPTVQESPVSETVNEPKPDSTAQKSPVTETVNEPKPDSTAQKSPVTETVNSEPKPDPTSQKSPVNETANELKPDSAENISAVPEPDSKEQLVVQNETDRLIAGEPTEASMMFEPYGPIV